LSHHQRGKSPQREEARKVIQGERERERQDLNKEEETKLAEKPD
jgi:hypothetical protein